METAKLKKALKIVCIICMVVYLLFVAVGILIATNIYPPEAYSEALGVTSILQGPDAAMYITILGIVIAIAYGVRALITIPVLRGIKNPSKMKPGIVLYGILVAFTLVNVVLTFIKGGDIATSFAQLFADVFILGYAIQIYRAEK